MGDGFDVVGRDAHQPSGQVGQCARDGQFVADVIDLAVGWIEPGETDADRLLGLALARVWPSCSSIEISTVQSLRRWPTVSSLMAAPAFGKGRSRKVNSPGPP